MISVNPDSDDGMGDVVISQPDPFDVYVDNKSRDLLFRDASYILIRKILPRKHLMNVFPDSARKIKKANSFDNSSYNYSEKVLLSNYLPMYFYKPKITFSLKKEDILSKNIYSCPQSLFKMHPSFDEAIKKILIKDKKAKIIFIKDRKEILSKMFFDRLKKKIPENSPKKKIFSNLRIFYSEAHIT